MKKISLLLVALATAFCALLLRAETQIVDGIWWEYYVSDGKATISGEYNPDYDPYPAISKSTVGAITIPSFLGGYPVTGIGEYTFYGCSGLTSVTIPESVTRIGEYAFSGCSGLTSVTIPESVTSIGEYAFSRCSDSIFDTTTIPGVKLVDGWAVGYTSSLSGSLDLTGIRGIGDRAFYGCGALASVTIPSGVTGIGNQAFYNCGYLSRVEIPDSVTSIGREAFYGCRNSLFDSLYDTRTIPGVKLVDGWAVGRTSPVSAISGSLDLTGIRGIGNSVFAECSGLTSVTMHEGLKSIGESAFYKCSGLTSMTIPDSVTSIGGSAFYGCSGLASVTIPDSVTSISYQAFYNCTNLTSVTIPESVTSIGSAAFYNCSSLNSVTIPDGVTSIGGSAFYGCSSLARVAIPDSVTSISCQAFYNCTNLTSVTIPERVTNIGERAFSGCSGLTSVTIPDSVTSIGDYAFYNCTNLASVTIPDSVTSIGSAAFNGCSSLTSVTIPDSVTSIGSGAFYGCSDSLFDTATIPGVKLADGWAVGHTSSLSGSLDLTGLRGIGNYAFSSCSNLTSVAMQDGVKSIGGGAFYNCTNLASVTIPDSVTNIGYSAFYGCSGLTGVTIPDSVTSIGNYAFYGCSGLTGVTIPDSVTNIGYSAFYGCRGLTGVTIPDSVTSIGDYAFYGCSGLTSVTIPDSVTSIGYDAFYGCSGLTSVTIPDSVTNIGYSAFYGCSSLTSVTIPDSVTSIGSAAFCGCSRLTSVTIPDSVTSIGSYAFNGCSGIASVTIPDSVTSIGSGAFQNCGNVRDATVPGWKCGIDFQNVTNLVISAGSTNIVSSAFSGCTNITSVTIPDSVTSIGYQAFYNCSGLTSVTIPDSVTSIGYDAFYGCSDSLYDTATIPGVRLVDGWAIDHTGSLSGSLDLTGVRGIGNGAFNNCSGLTSLTIPASVKSFGGGAFFECFSLTGVYIDDIANWCSISFGDGESSNPLAFAHKLYLNGNEVVDLVIPDGVTSIGNYAFYGCSGLTSVTIPDSVKSIGDYAFYCFGGLTSVTFLGNAPTVGGSSFPGVDYDCVVIVQRGSTGWGVDIPGMWQGMRIEYAPCKHEGGTRIENAVEPTCTAEGYTGDTVCDVCDEIISSGEAIAALGHAFGEVVVVRKATVFEAGEMARVCDRCGETTENEPIPILSKAGLRGGFDSLTQATNSIGGGITVALNGSTVSADGELLTIGEKGIYVGFEGGAELVSIIVECEGLTAPAQGLRALFMTHTNSGYDGIRQNREGLAVTTSGALQGVWNNEAWNDAAGAIPLDGERMFLVFAYNKYGGVSLYAIRDGQSRILYQKDSLRSGQDGILGVMVGGSLTNAFPPCTGLVIRSLAVSTNDVTGSIVELGEDEPVTLPGRDGTMECVLGGLAWRYSISDNKATICGLTEAREDLVIPNEIAGFQVGAIANDAFTDRNALVSVTIPAGVTSIDTWAFRDRSSLTNFIVDENNPRFRAVEGMLLTKDGRALVSGINGDVTVPESVTTIWWGAFETCSGLTNVTIPASVTRIDGWAFHLCNNLTSIEFLGNAPSLGDGVFYNVGEGCVAIVPYGSTGYDVDESGKWHGLTIIVKKEAKFTEVTARQRSLWDGLVDIDCNVLGLDAAKGKFAFSVSVEMPGSSEVRRASHLWVVRDGENSTNLEVREDGAYRIVWDAKADLGNIKCDGMVVRVSIVEVRGKVQLWEGGPYWAETNIGADEPLDYGYYFWWGDTVGYRREGKAWVATDGSSSNFKFDNDPVSQQTSNKNISTLQSEGWIVSEEGTYVLAPEHDAAHVHWGGSWRMPTKQELSDLNNNCDWTWTTQNGVNGYVVRGRSAYASASIFLPCAGDGDGTSHHYAGSDGFYWSSVPDSDRNLSWRLYFDSGHHGTDYRYRVYGRSVRPVQGLDSAEDRVVCSAASAAMKIDTTVPEVASVTAKQRYPWNGKVDIDCNVLGLDATKGKLAFSVSVEMPGFGEVHHAANLTVVRDGEESADLEVREDGAYRIVWDARADLGDIICDDMVVRVSLVDVRGKVQLWEGGPYWAETNIGADEPWNRGYYFWWGDIVGYEYANDAWVASDGSSSNSSFVFGSTLTQGKDFAALQSEKWIAEDGVLASEHDAAYAQWGGNWRMPTKQEIDEINSMCDWTWTTTNGVRGFIVRGRGDYASDSIFLPCGGLAKFSSPEVTNSWGYFWSSTPVSPGSNFSFSLEFTSTTNRTQNFCSRYQGFSVRPVQGFDSAEDRVVCCGTSAAIAIDTVTINTEPLVETLVVSWDAAWIGGDSDATVVIADNGTEVKRASGAGEFEYAFSGASRHELTYTTYIDGVAQDEVYSFVVHAKQWTCEDCLDAAKLKFVNDNEAAWMPDEAESKVGNCSLRSGAIAAAEEGERTLTTLTATVVGEGRGSFWWKVNCEDMDAEYDEWYDYAVFTIDGEEVAKIAGVCDWEQVEFTVSGDGEHTLAWTFTRDGYDEDETAFENAAWLDGVVWIPEIKTLTQAVDAEELAFTTGGDTEWTIDKTVGWADGDGVSARSGAVTNGLSSWIETTVNGTGTLMFRWNVMGGIYRNTPFAYSKVEVDGVQKAQEHTTDGWKEQTLGITGAGEHTVRWTYMRTSARSADGDCAWLDAVAWTPDEGAAESVAIQVGDVAVEFEATAGGKSRTATIPAGTTAEDIVVKVGGVDVTQGFRVVVDGTIATIALMNPYEVECEDGKPSELWTDNGDDSVTLNVAVVPGLYYAAASAQTLEGLSRPAVNTPAKPGDTLTVPKQAGSRGFYRVWVSDAPF